MLSKESKKSFKKSPLIQYCSLSLSHSLCTLAYTQIFRHIFIKKRKTSRTLLCLHFRRQYRNLTKAEENFNLESRTRKFLFSPACICVCVCVCVCRSTHKFTPNRLARHLYWLSCTNIMFFNYNQEEERERKE